MTLTIRSFQFSVTSWLCACFDGQFRSLIMDTQERNRRLLEESLELVQAAGMTKDDVLKLVEYAYSRPPGSVEDEIGDVAITLSALASAHSLDLENCIYEKHNRNWTRLTTIRDKQLAKKMAGV